MITIFVTKEGYYVAGEDTEATLKCSPATDDRGNPIFQESHHTYKVLYLALKEIARKKTIQGDVIVYNDSRIIDELNGQAQPLDDVCRRWQQVIRRELIPSIRSIVIFRKKNSEYIRSHLKNGESLLANNDPEIMNDLVSKITSIEKREARSFKARALDRFKRMWKNEQQ